MDVMVVGDFVVKPGHEPAFKQAFTDRSPTSGARPSVKQVHFGRSTSDPARYRRVGIWPSEQDWQAFQESDEQRRFWSELREHLAEDPSFGFYELVG